MQIGDLHAEVSRIRIQMLCFDAGECRACLAPSPLKEVERECLCARTQAGCHKLKRGRGRQGAVEEGGPLTAQGWEQGVVPPHSLFWVSAPTTALSQQRGVAAG